MFNFGHGKGFLDGDLTHLTFGVECAKRALDQDEMIDGSKEAQAREVIEPQDLFGVRAKAIFELGQERIEFLEGARFPEPMVKLHAQRGFVDVGIRQGCVVGELDLGLRERWR